MNPSTRTCPIRQTGKAILVFIAVLNFAFPPHVVAQGKVDIAFWTQAWFQHVENGKGNSNLNDFMIRRAYMSVRGQPTEYLGFFTHIATDRFGQDGLDIPALGLGSGLTFRDLWITLTLSESFKIQAGRMYVPLTRNYGTTSTKALMTTDLSFVQGGVRGGIFYTSKVGRDDGVTFWGNPFNGRMQYRLMISEGMEGVGNPTDKLRLVGRIVFNLLEPEKEWFNQGTYLGQRRILGFGAAFDKQNDLTLNDQTGRDNFNWTVDAFFDHPVGSSGITLETAFINIENGTQTTGFTEFVSGDSAGLFYLQAGFFIGPRMGMGNLQPYFRYEKVSVKNKNDTRFLSGGFNYFIKGHNAKISMDYTLVDQVETADQGIVTVQLAVGI